MATNISIGNYINRGRLKTHTFHKSLVDYWNFAGKKNSDTDRTTIKGIKGNILNAYNFNWSLSSGYGLFKENYTTYRQFNYNRAMYTFTSDSIHVTESLTRDAYSFIETSSTTFANAYSIEVKGLQEGISLRYNYVSSDTKESKIIFITKDGIYNLPQTGNGFNGFSFNGYKGPCDITIRQIPEYEGAIVTDGIDDYLKLNKVGYKIGTVIIKAIPLTVNENSYVFDVEIKRTYFSYLLNTDNTIRPGFSFNSKRVYGNYDVLRYNDNNIANIYTPMFIGCRFNIDEYISMALYEIAVYQDVLTEEQVLAEIDKMNKL